MELIGEGIVYRFKTSPLRLTASILIGLAVFAVFILPATFNFDRLATIILSAIFSVYVLYFLNQFGARYFVKREFLHLKGGFVWLLWVRSVSLRDVKAVHANNLTGTVEIITDRYTIMLQNIQGPEKVKNRLMELANALRTGDIRSEIPEL